MISANEILRRAISDNVVCQFPGGDVVVEEPLVVTDGLIMRGCGSHKNSSHQTGTTLKPATGYNGSAIINDRSIAHLSLKDFRTEGFKTDALLFEEELAAGFILDNVVTIGNRGDGLVINHCLAGRIGTYEGYSNAGAALKTVGGASVLDIQMIAGDNNECLVSANSNDESCLNISSFRAERWDSKNSKAGHETIFEVNQNGGIFRVNQGSVHSSEKVKKGNTVFNITSPGIVEIGHITATNKNGYELGYTDIKKRKVQFKDLLRRRHYFGLNSEPAS
jgi:hypothetical protein